MLTKADKKFLKESFATKNDLKAMEKRQNNRFITKNDLKDFRQQINDDIDGKLAKQKEDIVKDVGEYIADTVVPMFEERDEQLARLNKKVGLPSLVD
ncbi:hypothetical protein A3A64_02920 [Candidatus Gottesmanbacteria bacterium RIFCSPLOWO2_01_FULL_48_11]|uniref:Uncharacterized protein n=1 Tax=Candidatus Gottesmanbacteria bacterium RIFCSPLOWO2_01_FULL_48_11 TaxID=1798395 RepID=A0A1F6ASU9_9BACT|nr:MAG: hypothetical protein A3A64_02920 [Candidatus Gottesmanbacteria bacterium RIFCSPLOWO2_01_FULL_48_11]